MMKSTEPENPLHARPACGAKTRSGQPCKNTFVCANGRCRQHAGMSTGAPGNANAVKHGIYRKRLTDEEQAEFDGIELGAVDHELCLTRIMIGRALAAEAAADGQPELDEVTENDGGGVAVPRESRRKKVKDYHSIIDRLIGRVESLEKTRMALILGAGSLPPDMVEEGKRLTTGESDEPGPPNPIA